jgi:imidazolonepropionase-like amidohydrolase
MQKTHFALICALLFTVAAFAQNHPTPAPAQTKSILLTGATVHIGNGNVLKNAAVGLRDGKITEVTEGVATQKYDETVDVKGKQIYPGFIAMTTLLGLRDIDAVRAQNDYAEVGAYNPNARALIAYNADSRVTPTVRSNGVLLAQCAPVGGVISGKSSVFELDGWNWDDAVVRIDDGLHLNWATIYQNSGWWAEPGATSRNKNYDDNVQSIKQFFAEAKAYCDQKNGAHNARFEAMRGVLEGKENLYIHVGEAKAMLDAITFAKAYTSHIVLADAEDAWRIADVLLENHISVILPETNRLPNRADDDIDLPYKMPALLAQKGVPFTFSIDGAWEQHDFIFQAGQAIGFGLPYEKAVEAGTLAAAKILGIDATLGSITVGKSATLIVTEGDVFDPRTATVERAYIRGKLIDLNNHQKALYERYKKRGVN